MKEAATEKSQAVMWEKRPEVLGSAMRRSNKVGSYQDSSKLVMGVHLARHL